MKTALAISLPIALLAIIFWKHWPKAMVFPDSEKPNLFEIADFEKMSGKRIESVPLKNGKPYLYTESEGFKSIGRGVMRNGAMDGKTFNFRANYQINSDSSDAKELFRENAMIGKLPGFSSRKLSDDESIGLIYLFTGAGTTYYYATLGRVFYMVQIEPELDLPDGIVANEILARLGRLQGK